MTWCWVQRRKTWVFCPCLTFSCEANFHTLFQHQMPGIHHLFPDPLHWLQGCSLSPWNGRWCRWEAKGALLSCMCWTRKAQDLGLCKILVAMQVGVSKVISDAHCVSYSRHSQHPCRQHRTESSPYSHPGKQSLWRWSHLPEVTGFIAVKSKDQALNHFFTPKLEFYLVMLLPKEPVLQFFYAKLHFSLPSDVWPQFCSSGSCSKLISLVNHPLISYDHRLSLDRSSRTWFLKNDIIILQRNEGNWKRSLWRMIFICLLVLLGWRGYRIGAIAFPRFTACVISSQNIINFPQANDKFQST